LPFLRNGISHSSASLRQALPQCAMPNARCASYLGEAIRGSQSTRHRRRRRKCMSAGWLRIRVAPALRGNSPWSAELLFNDLCAQPVDAVVPAHKPVLFPL
jgi:hypothetical protein